MTYILIGFAGMIGALLRYGVSLMFDFSGDTFPFGTFAVNILGSFMLGWFTTRIKQANALSPQLLTAIGTGLIGSFTTFSTFSLETSRLIQNTYFGTAFLYAVLSLILGLAAAWAGYTMGHYLLQGKEAREPS